MRTSTENRSSDFQERSPPGNGCCAAPHRARRDRWSNSNCISPSYVFHRSLSVPRKHESLITAGEIIHHLSEHLWCSTSAADASVPQSLTCLLHKKLFILRYLLSILSHRTMSKPLKSLRAALKQPFLCLALSSHAEQFFI